MNLYSLCEISKNRLVLPKATLGALGIGPSSLLYLCLDASNGKGGLANEILLTPIQLERRYDLWVFNAVFVDRPGILSALSAKLSDLKIDILSTTASSAEGNRFLNVRMLLDCKLYTSDQDENTTSRAAKRVQRLGQLTTYLIASLVDDILFDYSARPILEIHRNIPLYRTTSKTQHRNNVVVKDNGVRVSKNIMQTTREHLANIYPHCGDTPFAFINTDTRHQLIRAYTFYANTGHVCFRVQLHDDIGIFHLLTKLLYSRGFNVINIKNFTAASPYTCFEIISHLDFDEHKDPDKLDPGINKYVASMIEDELPGAKVAILELKA